MSSQERAGAESVCILAVQNWVTKTKLKIVELEHTLLLEASNELINGTNFDTGFTDRRLLNSDSLKARGDVDAKVFRFHLVDSLLTGLLREKSER